MVVPTEAEAAAQKGRLETLGYTIFDISPPLSDDLKVDTKEELTDAFLDSTNYSETMAK
jgi:hypothetical protein